MSNATATRTNTPAATAAKATTAPKAKAVTATAPTVGIIPAYSVDAFREAVEAVDAAGTYSAAASATLASATLDRYAYHASRFARTVDGVTTLPDTERKEVATLVWLDGIGRTQAPSAKDRTSAQTSLGQYISRFGTVATNLAHGTAALTDPETAAAAYAAISESKADAKKREAEAAAALEAQAGQIEFAAWLESRSTEVRESFAFVVEIITGGINPEDRQHAEAFIASIQAKLV